MESRIFKSETIDHIYLEIEIVDGHGVLYEVYSRGDSFDASYICDVYSDTPSYDGKVDWYQLEFLESLFPNIKKL